MSSRCKDKVITLLFERKSNKISGLILMFYYPGCKHSCINIILKYFVECFFLESCRKMELNSSNNICFGPKNSNKSRCKGRQAKNKWNMDSMFYQKFKNQNNQNSSAAGTLLKEPDANSKRSNTNSKFLTSASNPYFVNAN